jgi:hypothetical protein
LLHFFVFLWVVTGSLLSPWHGSFVYCSSATIAA